MSGAKTSNKIGQEYCVFPVQAGLAVMTSEPNTSHIDPEHKVYPYLAHGFRLPSGNHRLVLVPGVHLADQYESDMLYCCHEGQRYQCFSGWKTPETEKQLFESIEWYNLDHFSYFWSLPRVNSATNSNG
ncbi:MAG: hypothetical protein NTY00_13220 [Deltaproteobacteria bacterium]|nr:hypothetical protein [Deltaproteobacteria bacterium]